jgi:hypothetical protein
LALVHLSTGGCNRLILSESYQEYAFGADAASPA